MLPAAVSARFLLPSSWVFCLEFYQISWEGWVCLLPACLPACLPVPACAFLGVLRSLRRNYRLLPACLLWVRCTALGWIFCCCLTVFVHCLRHPRLTCRFCRFLPAYGSLRMPGLSGFSCLGYFLCTCWNFCSAACLPGLYADYICLLAACLLGSHGSLFCSWVSGFLMPGIFWVLGFSGFLWECRWISGCVGSACCLYFLDYIYTYSFMVLMDNI